MSNLARGASVPAGNKALFEQQREALLADIGVNFEHVLQNINKLNRALEGVIAVGNEFGSVEALWSHFESVMGKEPEPHEVPEGSADREGHESADDENMTETVDTAQQK